ncbi:hypothetical protein [Clostridium sp. HBUAS56010]|uniref:hypothetical protein n=1 Tax=Clostridium sp. HBUAS56010 TaxID=2571127 RepID=UPI0011782294|nr:hypothetical protein [Clostridium sp. HBUAS56010]
MRYISDEDYKRIMKKKVGIDQVQIFSSEQECLEHEKALAAERAKQEKLLTEKNRRSDEVKKLGNDFIELHKKYVNDYGEEISFDSDLESLASLYSSVWPFFFRTGRIM